MPNNVVDVTRPEQWNDVLRALESVRELAVDVEADSMHHFRARLCFVQLGTDADIFLSDTLAEGVTPRALEKIFADANVTKFFHAAQGDLQYLAEAGVRVRGLFDTHRAVTLLGWPKNGLADLVKEKLGATLKKEHQQADFSIRPLPPELREYIADDVRYLSEVGRWVREACVTADILEEVLLDCERFCDEAAARPDPANGFSPKLQRQNMSKETLTVAWHVAQELHRRRLAWAEAADVPMGRMLSNMAVSAIAQKLPADARALAKCEGVRGVIVREHGDEILAMLLKVQADVKSGALSMPDEKKDRDPKRRKREEVLMDWRKKRATERKVTPSVVLSNALVDELATTPPVDVENLSKVPYFGQKRLTRDGASLVEVLAPYR
ncbi:MAG: ribonuclease D [Archangium sp.]